MGTPDLARHPAGRRQVGFGQPQVVGHERRPGPDGGGAGGRMRGSRSAVGGQGAPRPPPHLGEGPLRSVEEARQPELRPGPPGEGVASGERGIDRTVVEERRRLAGHQGDPRDDVERPDPRMGPCVTGQVDELHRGPGHGPDGGPGLFRVAGHGDHGAVVVHVGVDIEEELPGLLRHLGDHPPVPALAHVQDALEQGRGRGLHAEACRFTLPTPRSCLIVIRRSSRWAGSAGYFCRGVVPPWLTRSSLAS